MKRILFFVCTMLTLLSTETTAKTLVVYYSYTGNSQEIVNTLTSQIEADVLENSNRNSLIENWLPTQNFHSSTTGISHVKSDVKKSKVYTLQGTLALVGQKGIVIKDGKKVAIK